MALDEIKRQCPVFSDNVCPFAKLPEEHKGVANKCPAFSKGCPFKECKTVGEFEHKLGQMRHQCKGHAAFLQFLRETHVTAKEKEAVVGSSCPFFQSRAGCPFAKDTNGKPILSPDYIVVCVYFKTTRKNSSFWKISSFFSIFEPPSKKGHGHYNVLYNDTREGFQYSLLLDYRLRC